MKDGQPLLAFHEATKHSPRALWQSSRTLDWSNLPRLEKVYRGAALRVLPQDLPRSSVPALEAVASSDGERGHLDLPTMAGLLHYAAGILRTRREHGKDVAFRAAPCTGALYHVEVYPVCAELAGLPAGVYHFSPRLHALHRLREGDYRLLLSRAADDEEVARAAAVLVLTSVWQRNAWKYGARAYRHVYWDTGTVLSQILATAAAYGLRARVVLGFVDREVARLLDLDADREFPVALVALGEGPDPHACPPAGPLGLFVEPTMRRQIHEPRVLAAHAASSFSSAEQVRSWKAARVAIQPPKGSGARYPLRPLPPGQLPQAPVEEVILRRRSTRRYSARPVSLEALSEVLLRTTSPLRADFLHRGASLVVPFLVVHAVEGLPPGAYVFHRDLGAVELLRPGSFRHQAAHFALDQPAAGEAAVVVAWMTRLQDVLQALGGRGYRAVQLEGGIRGGRVYLVAHALGLRATALTFYDDEVTDFFQAPGWSPMFLTVFGRKA